jgi:Family of unknown function (DUF5681)
MKHPRTAHLESHKWKPGQSGNPGGRPRKQPITEALAKEVSELDAADMARVVVATAKAGNLQALQFIADRLEGKAVARNEHGEPGDFELTLEQVRKVLELGKYRDPSRRSLTMSLNISYVTLG